MTWLEVIDGHEDAIDAVAYGFLHHSEITDVPPKPHLFRKAAEHYFGPDSTMPYEWHPWNLRGIELLCEHPYLAIIGCANSSKCLAPSTPVLMFDGTIKQAHAIQTGDLLMGDDSTPRTVLSTGIGRSNMVRIVPRHGDAWECNDDHVLTLKRTWAGKKSWRTVGNVIDIAVKDYVRLSPTMKRKLRLFSNGVEFASQPVEFDPQIYGIWLGDGSTGKPVIHCHDSEKAVIGFMTDYFSKKGYQITQYRYKKNGKDRCPAYCFNQGITGGTVKNPFRDFVRESSPNGEKRILWRYLHNDRASRLKLLAGLIDSDGTGANSYFIITSSLHGLTQDIVFLARSLGFIVSVTRRDVKSSNGTMCWTNCICIMGKCEYIPTLRKRCTPRIVRRNSIGTSCFSIEQLGEGNWCGFTLDGNGRFLLGDFTVTHNTDLGAIWGLLNWRFDPENTLVLITSTTLKDSRKRMWGRITRYAEAIHDLPAKIIDSAGVIRAEIPGKRLSDASSISLIAGEKKNEREAIGRLIGMKNKRVILIADELPELSDALFYAFLSNLSVNPQPQMLGEGNFASIYDPLGEFSRPVNGWGSITPDDTEWVTERGYCLRYDGLKSPNFDLPKDKWKFIYNRKNLADHKKNLGDNSIEFWRMCRSFPCPAGTQDTIYSDSDFLAVGAEHTPNFDREPVKVAMLDPAYTHDGDRCPVVFGNYGRVGGINTLAFSECKLLIEDVTRINEPRDFQIARQFKAECEQRGIKPENSALDSTGAGKPFLSIVHEVWSNAVTGIEFGGSASNIPVFSHDRRPAKDLYANRVAEIWVSGREYLRGGQLKGIFPDLAREMKARQYPKATDRQTVNRKIVIETKKQMKSRVGWSPDLADAGLGLVDFCRQRFGFLAETGTQSFGRIRASFKELALQHDEVHHHLYRAE